MRRGCLAACWWFFPVLSVLVGTWASGLGAPGAMAEEAVQTPVEFNRDIRPILSDRCYICHGPDSGQRATELRLDQEESALADLGGYRAIVPGQRDQSELWRRIRSTDPDEQMPPPDSGRKLQPAEIERLGRWIDEGAKWQQHWSFIPPRRPPLPQVARADWPRNPIDHFILARLEREGLAPSPQASKETLIRRVTLDLTGLPPTLEEIDAFLADDSPEAYEKLVDRLLASPRYGERMVLEWLDAARYADTNGYQTDGTRAMWPWRDGVIEALNRNMPFDQFTIEQLAGDLLPEPTLAQRLATGFHRNHMLNGEGGRIAEESRVEYVVDRVDTTATVWLGLTLACARCHDHKYDPFSQREFYQFYAYFNNVAETGAVDRRSSTAAPTLDLPTDAQQRQIAEQSEKIAALEERLKAETERLRGAQRQWEESVDRQSLPEAVAAALAVEPAARSAEQTKAIEEHYLASDAARKAVQQELDEAKKSLEKLRNSVLITMVMEERPQPRATHVLIRGQYDQYGEQVEAGLPAAVAAGAESSPPNRLGLARWLVHPENPLTARVTVNRYWQMFFGTGLVKTAEDFGSQGEPPSHPELLDWLAVEFMSPERPASAWDVKAMHRLMVTSATYRQASRVTPELQERDPDNRLLARGPRYRWNSHLLRDQALAAAGLLVEKLGGAPVRPYQPAGIWEDFSFGKIVYQQDHGEDLYRRSIYTFWRRSVGPTNLFDTGPRQVCTVRQQRTNTPLQSLVLWNDPTYVEAARALAERAVHEGGSTPPERLQWAFRVLTARRPKAAELDVLLGAYERLLKRYQGDRAAAEQLLAVGESPRDPALEPAEHAALAAVMSLLMNLDEVLSKE